MVSDLKCLYSDTQNKAVKPRAPKAIFHIRILTAQISVRDRKKEKA